MLHQDCNRKSCCLAEFSLRLRHQLLPVFPDVPCSQICEPVNRLLCLLSVSLPFYPTIITEFIIYSMLLLLLLSRFSHVRLCATPQTAAHQAPPSLGFSRQEYWSGVPLPSPYSMLHVAFYYIQYIYIIYSDQIRPVAQSCLTLCDPINRSTPVLPVHHQLPEFTQTHVHRVSDAIQLSHPLSSPSPPAPNPSQHQSLFQ